MLYIFFSEYTGIKNTNNTESTLSYLKIDDTSDYAIEG